MDVDEIDRSLHEIEQMLLVANRVTDDHLGNHETGLFEMSRADAEMLAFAVSDLQKRVSELREDLYPRESAKAPVLTLVASRPDMSA